MEVPPLLSALREATAEMHKDVERQTPFFSPAFDRQAYVRWLDVMHPFYGAVDRAVDESGFRAATGWSYRPRTELINRDLACLVQRAPAPVAAAPEVLEPIVSLRRHGQIAGMLYVIEGSALGGQVLLKVLGRAAGVTADEGASFFAPHGDNPRTPWASYIGLLAGLSGDPQVCQDAVQGAVATFTTLGRWIDVAWAHGA
jgi:heme oxygenase